MADEAEDVDGEGEEEEYGEGAEGGESEEDLMLDDGDISEEDETTEQDGESKAESEMSSISNETEVSEIMELETRRQTAQVFPDVPWKNLVRHCRMLAMAVLLPFVLVLVLVYAFLKCIQAIVRLFVDFFIVLRQMVMLAVRVSLSPLYIAWKLLLPRAAQDAIHQYYDARLGKYLRRLYKLMMAFFDFINDLPNIATACGLAFLEMCVMPAKVCTEAFCWAWFGQYVNTYVAQPLVDSSLNFAVKRRRSQAGLAKKEIDIKKKHSESHGARRKKMIAERKRRVRAKKKLASLEIVLNVEITSSGKKREQTVILQDKARNQLLSRTMVMERRYGIAVGFVWCIIGATLLIVVLDGAEEETCTICQENPELGVQVCRHGRGRDCAFFHHMDQTFIAVGIVGVGALLMAYSIFLYKPQRLAEKKVMEDKEKEARENSERVEITKKLEDPEIQAIMNLQEEIRAFSCARFFYKLHKATPLHTIIMKVSGCIEVFLGRAMVKFEKKWYIREWAVSTQYAIYLLCGGYAAQALEFAKARYLLLTKKIYAAESPQDLTQFERVVVGFVCFWQVLGTAFSHTPCGRPIARRVQRSVFWRKAVNIFEELMTVSKGGPNRSVLAASMKDSGRANTRMTRTMAMNMLRRTGSRKNSQLSTFGSTESSGSKKSKEEVARTLEEVLHQFGLDGEHDDEQKQAGEADEEKESSDVEETRELAGEILEYKEFEPIGTEMQEEEYGDEFLSEEEPVIEAGSE